MIPCADRPSRGDYDEDYDDRYYRRRYGPGYGATQDEDHLRILSVLYYVLGALSLVGGLVPLLFVFIGAMILEVRAPAMGRTKPSRGR